MLKITSEIFEKSQCLTKETNVITEVELLLTETGFNKVDPYTWTSGSKQVILRIVDDFTRICGSNWNSNFVFGLPEDTLVITDNLVTEITQFDVFRLPDSFFGIYAYVPEVQHYNPDRRYSLLVNRLDSARIVVLLDWFSRELKNEIGNLDQLAYVTFNCVSATLHSRMQLDTESLESEFAMTWNEIDRIMKNDLYRAYSILSKSMPYRNFTIPFDEVMCRSMLNMVIETYINNEVLSLSEKTFRALVTPSPSLIYGSRYMSVWLKRLGFDIVDEFLDYSFERFSNLNSIRAVNRSANYSLCAQRAYASVSQAGTNYVTRRMQSASSRNVEVLQSYAEQWPEDYANWKQDLRTKLLRFKNS